jgi:hypothetical protein
MILSSFVRFAFTRLKEKSSSTGSETSTNKASLEGVASRLGGGGWGSRGGGSDRGRSSGTGGSDRGSGSSTIQFNGVSDKKTTNKILKLYGNSNLVVAGTEEEEAGAEDMATEDVADPEADPLEAAAPEPACMVIVPV